MDYIQFMQIRFVKSLYRSCVPTTFRTTKKKKNAYLTKEVKGIKINLDLIFNNFSVHRMGLQLV